MFHALSPVLHWGICFFQLSYSRPSNSLPYGWPASRVVSRGRTDGVFTFHVIDLLTRRLRRVCTPAALQFRAGTLSTRNLSACVNAGKHIFDLLIPVRSVLIDDAATLRLFSPYCLDPSPYSREIRTRVFSLTASTHFGTLSRRLHTPSSAQRQHASLGSGGNTPGAVESNLLLSLFLSAHSITRHRVANNA